MCLQQWKGKCPRQWGGGVVHGSGGECLQQWGGMSATVGGDVRNSGEIEYGLGNVRVEIRS